LKIINVVEIIGFVISFLSNDFSIVDSTFFKTDLSNDILRLRSMLKGLKSANKSRAEVSIKIIINIKYCLFIIFYCSN
jgi:hypothetical protein